MCQKCWANHLAEHALNLSQVTIHTYWEGLHQKKHKSSHLPKPCPAAMWYLEYPVSVTLTKLINKQNLFHTVIVRNFPWITESAFYCPGPGFSTQVCLASHSSPQNLTLSWHWVDWFNVSQSFSTLALLTFGAGYSFVVKAILCIIGYLTASLVSTHETPLNTSHLW